MGAFIVFSFLLSLLSSILTLCLYRIIIDCLTGEVENKKYYKTLIENYNRKKVQK